MILSLVKRHIFLKLKSINNEVTKKNTTKNNSKQNQKKSETFARMIK